MARERTVSADEGPWYAWCCICDGPVTGIENELEDKDMGAGLRKVPTGKVTVNPCGHTSWQAVEAGLEAVGKAGVVTTVGVGVGPIPSISIAGRS